MHGLTAAALALAFTTTAMAQAQSRYDDLANLPFKEGYVANDQPFPSINAMDKPAKNADASMDIYFGPKSPGQGKNWLATIPDKGFFVVFRLYGPKKAFYDQTWKLPDIENVKLK